MKNCKCGGHLPEAHSQSEHDMARNSRLDDREDGRGVDIGKVVGVAVAIGAAAVMVLRFFGVLQS